MHAPPVEPTGNLLHLDQRQLRGGKHDDVDLVADGGIGGVEGLKVVPPYRYGGRRDPKKPRAASAPPE